MLQAFVDCINCVDLPTSLAPDGCGDSAQMVKEYTLDVKNTSAMSCRGQPKQRNTLYSSSSTPTKSRCSSTGFTTRRWVVRSDC